jgi:hemerythrin superfamily protein
MATEAESKSSRSRSTNRSENGRSGGSTGALIGAAAAGVAVGLMANLGRKAAVQAPTMMAGDWDEALAAEHQAVMKLFDAMQATTEKNTTKRSMLLMQMKHSLAKHAIEEENAVYPALRDAGQTEEADHLNHDHGYVKQFLYDLENMPKDSPAFLAKIGEFRRAVEEHAREEEDKIFPKLKAKLSPEMNKALTAAMNKEGFKLA